MMNRSVPSTATNSLLIVFAAIILLPLVPFRVAAQAPGTISFQGKLTDTGGTPTNATVSMTFKLYKGGTDVWTEVNPSVTVTNGIFDVVLGNTTPLDTLRFDRPMELGIAVDGNPEISPRVELTAAAFARALPGFSTQLVVTGGGNDSTYNILGGGHINQIDPDSKGATISGGGGIFLGDMRPNLILSNSDYSTISGGDFNTLAGSRATIGGGSRNETNGSYATVAGGFTNHAAATGATVGGGTGNVATGYDAAVPGGQSNAARGDYSFAAGFNARPHHEGSFVWGDRSGNAPADSIITTGNNQFLIRAAGGVGIGTNNPGSHSVAINDDGAGGIPGATLEVDNSSTSNAIAAHFETSGTDATVVIDQDGSGVLFKAFQGGDLKFQISNAGNVTADGSFTGSGADVAEAVDVHGRLEEFEAGDVLVVSRSEDRSFALSRGPYSDLVAGVYATKPGVLMTNRGVREDLSDRVPMGIMGIIPTKVTGENGPIRRGDLLVTSSTPGHAMRADRSRLEFGMALGKALEPFDGPGRGVIEVLVMPR